MINIPKPDVCIYHDPCTDGFVSALVVWLRFGNIEFYPGVHEKGKDDLDLWIPRVKDKNVVICDFSFSRKMTELLAAEAKSLTVIDHHKSASETLGDLPYCHFDMSKSGALLTWEAFFESAPPKLVQYVSDHDLWQHKLPHSHEIAAAIGYKEKNAALWSMLLAKMEGNSGFEELRMQGEAVLNMLRATSRDLVAKGLLWKIAGSEVIALNGVSPITNEVCDALRNKFPDKPVASYEVLTDNVKFSLRSLGDIDVKEIAVKMGGGGHKNSASFTIPLDKLDLVSREVNP